MPSGSHSVTVTCHPTEVRILPLSPAEAGTQFSDPGEMQGWVDLRYVKATGWELNPRPVNRKSNALPLSHHATQQCPVYGFSAAIVHVQLIAFEDSSQKWSIYNIYTLHTHILTYNKICKALKSKIIIYLISIHLFNLNLLVSLYL